MTREFEKEVAVGMKRLAEHASGSPTKPVPPVEQLGFMDTDGVVKPPGTLNAPLVPVAVVVPAGPCDP
jgi:hypothetical protein